MKSRNLVMFVTAILLLVMLSGCSNTDLKTKLQENEWTVLEDGGSSYDASFSEKKATFGSGIFSSVFEYEVNGNEVTYTNVSNDKVVTYIVKEDSDELIFELQEEVDGYTTYTLIPKN